METLASVNPFDYDPMMLELKYMGELLRTVLYRNSFEFNNEFFVQISGVPMGQRSSPSTCNLVVHILEKKIINLSPHIHTLFRFMDDTLVFLTGSIQELEDLVKTANTLHPTLKITHEVSTETIQFLDLVIYKGERFKSTGILDIKCHTKKTETGQYLHRTSRCSMVMGSVVSRDSLGLRRIGAPGYRAHRSVAMVPMFKGIRFGRHHFCSEV